MNLIQAKRLLSGRSQKAYSQSIESRAQLNTQWMITICSLGIKKDSTQYIGVRLLLDAAIKHGETLGVCETLEEVGETVGVKAERCRTRQDFIPY